MASEYGSFRSGPFEVQRRRTQSAEDVSARIPRLYSPVSKTAKGATRRLEAAYRSAYGEPEVAATVGEENYDQSEIEDFIKSFAFALLKSGLPTYAVKFYILMASQRFALPLHVKVAYDAVWLTFGPDSVSHMVVIGSPEMSLADMTDASVIAEAVLGGHLALQDSIQQLNVVSKRKARWADWTVPVFSILGFASAPLFGGGYIEMLAGAVLGACVGVITALSTSSKHLARGYELLIGIVSSIAAVLINHYICPISTMSVILAAVLWALPGFRITLSMADMATGDIGTGSAKFISAFVVCINLGFGIIAGLKLEQLLHWETILATPVPVPPWVKFLCVLLDGLAFGLILDAKPTHFPHLIGGMTIAFYICSYASVSFGQTVGSWVGIFFASMLSNIYSRLARHSSIEISLFSVLMLVPGSIGVKGVVAQGVGSTESMLTFFTSFISIALAIVAGLFSANIVIPPFRTI